MRPTPSAFSVGASNEYSLDLVYRNVAELQKRGIYERALIDAFIATRTNNYHWPLKALRLLFNIANRERCSTVNYFFPSYCLTGVLIVADHQGEGKTIREIAAESGGVEERSRTGSSVSWFYCRSSRCLSGPNPQGWDVQPLHGSAAG